MTALLELRDIGISFGGLRAVDRLSFGVEEGQIVGLIGPNGAGKTTVFNIITGLYPPTDGELFWRGARITGTPPHRIAALGIQRTFQTIRLFHGMSVFENVRAGCHLDARQRWWQGMLRLPVQRHEEAALADRTHDVLRRLNLDRVADEPATALPYGMQRRVELARALAGAPRLIVLDEPAAGLNDAESAAMSDTIFGIRDAGTTILLVEHDMNVVMGVTDQIVVMNFGRKIAQGTPAEIRNNEAVIEAYLGREDVGGKDTI
jgi:branched-chain amino acid transport system ATP-binding protein